jgi:hypothetical protein
MLCHGKVGDLEPNPKKAQIHSIIVAHIDGKIESSSTHFD